MKIRIGDYNVEVTATHRQSYLSEGDNDTYLFLNNLAFIYSEASHNLEEAYPRLSRMYREVQIEIVNQLNETGFYDHLKEEE